MSSKWLEHTSQQLFFYLFFSFLFSVLRSSAMWICDVTLSSCRVECYAAILHSWEQILMFCTVVWHGSHVPVFAFSHWTANCFMFLGEKKREKGKKLKKNPPLLMLYDLDLLYSSSPPPCLLWKVIFRCVLSVVLCHSCIHSLNIVVVVYGDEINPNLCRIPLFKSLSSPFLSLSAPDLTAGRTKALTVPLCKHMCLSFANLAVVAKW